MVSITRHAVKENHRLHNVRVSEKAPVLSVWGRIMMGTKRKTRLGKEGSSALWVDKPGTM